MHPYSKMPLSTGPKGPFTPHSGPIEDIVLHYLWTPPGSPWPMSRVAKLHTKHNGWNGPGYHYLIRTDGRVEFGRPEWARGAHVRGKNDRKIGVVYEGGRLPGSQDGHDTRTPEQIEAMIRLCKELLRRHPEAKVSGHRDHVATQCPGFDAGAWWYGLEQGVTKGALRAKDAPAVVAPTPASDRGSWLWVLIDGILKALGR